MANRKFFMWEAVVSDILYLIWYLITFFWKTLDLERSGWRCSWKCDEWMLWRFLDPIWYSWVVGFLILGALSSEQPSFFLGSLNIIVMRIELLNSVVGVELSKPTVSTSDWELFCHKSFCVVGKLTFVKGLCWYRQLV